MIAEFERYHGVVLRRIVVEAPGPILMEKKDEAGRENSYVLNGRVAIHIKHSSKRLPSWSFSFSIEQLREFVTLKRQADSVWLVLVCGTDGMVSLSLDEFVSITGSRPGGVASLRIDRGRREMYRVYGNEGELPNAKPRGVAPIVSAAAAIEIVRSQ
jgi:hypothetical protein